MSPLGIFLVVIAGVCMFFGGWYVGDRARERIDDQKLNMLQNELSRACTQGLKDAKAMELVRKEVPKRLDDIAKLIGIR